jgi:hypothetical protein
MVALDVRLFCISLYPIKVPLTPRPLFPSSL